jgi:hypothetical protein
MAEVIPQLDGLYFKRQSCWGTHSTHSILLPLLPSGSDGFHKATLREAQQNCQKIFKRINSADHLLYLYPTPNHPLGVMGNSHLPPWLMVAEREGFEPSVGVNLHTLSKRAPSTARPPLLLGARPASYGSTG